MESRRKQQNWDNRRSKNKRPPRSSSLPPTVPRWEKQFCKEIGRLDWETILYLKKSMYLFEDVLNWDDSAGEEAFFNAKKRYWAQINGLPCDIALPSPDLYIDEVNWDDYYSDNSIDTESLICDNFENHEDPVIIFGDSLLPNYQGYSTTGWGDAEENQHQVAANTNTTPVDQWGNSGNNWAENDWPVYSNNYSTWEGGWNDNNNWGWNHSNNNFEEQNRVEGDKYMSSFHGQNHYGNDVSRQEMTYLEEQPNTEKRPNSFDSCAHNNHYGAVTVGQTWDRWN